MAKRLLDVAVAAVGLVVLSPLLLVIAVLVRRFGVSKRSVHRILRRGGA